MYTYCCFTIGTAYDQNTLQWALHNKKGKLYDNLSSISNV